MFGLRIKTLGLCHVDIYMSRQNQNVGIVHGNNARLKKIDEMGLSTT